MSSILPSSFPMCHDEHKRVPMHHHDFKEFLAVANKIQTEKKGPESIILFCNILSFLQGCANDGKWDPELDQLLLNTMRFIMSLMTEENTTSIQTIYHRGAAKPIASLCSFFLTTRCRLRRSGPLQKECLTLLASALELLLVQGRPGSPLEVLDILDAFVSCPASVIPPTSIQFWDMFDPKVLPWLVDKVFV